MVINRNSWHYKVYDFTYLFSRKATPRQTNLCQYVRRFLLLPWIGILATVMAAFMVIIITCAFTFGPIFGYVPKTFNPLTFFEHDMHKYQGVKFGKSYNAFQLYPWHIILGLMFIAGHVAIYYECGIHPLVTEGEWVVGIVAAIAAFIGVMVYLDSSTGKVINGYLAAKKQKVCPVVEFKNEE